MQRLRQVNTSDRVLQQIQANIGNSLDPLVSNPLMGARVVSGVQLVSGQTNRVAHGLGRRLLGWFVVGQDGASSVYDAQADEKAPELFLALIVSASVNVNLVVF